MIRAPLSATLLTLLPLTAAFAQAAPHTFQPAAIRAPEPRAAAQRAGDKSAGSDAALTKIERLYEEGAVGDAIPLAEQLLSRREKSLGPEHPETVRVLNLLASLCNAKGDYARAERLLLRSLPVSEKLFGPEHPSVANVLGDLALALLHGKKNYGRAEALLTRALGIRERAGVWEHADTAALFEKLAELDRARGDGDGAERLYLRALALRVKAEGTDTIGIALALLNLSALLSERNADEASEVAFGRAIKALEKTAEAKHPRAPLILHDLAERYEEGGQDAQAEGMYLRALIACEQALGQESEFTAMVLNNLAELYRKQRRYRKAEPLFLRALRMREKLFGPEYEKKSAVTFNNLALLYKQQGDYAKAEALYARSLDIDEKEFGSRHPESLRNLNNLARLYVAKGDYAKAILLYERVEPDVAALAPLVAEDFESYMLLELAVLYHAEGNAAKAEPLFKRVFQMEEAKTGKGWQVGVVSQLAAAAGNFLRNGHAERAQRALQRALAISEQAEYGHDVAMMLNQLATVYRMQGEYDKAEESSRRAVSIHGGEEGDEPGDPDVTELFGEVAVLRQLRGDTAGAIKALAYANEVREKNLSIAILRMGFKQGDGEGGMAGLEDETYTTITLNIRRAPDNVDATRLALTTILRRKGRVLDYASTNMRRLHESADPGARELLAGMATARARYAATVLKGSRDAGPYRHMLQLAELEIVLDRLNTSIRVTNNLGPIVHYAGLTSESIQAHIPPDAALVEIAQYDPFNFKHATLNDMWEPSRYAAYVLHGEGAPVAVDLGEAAPINQAVTALRAALRDPRRADVKAAARALDEKVMKPLRAKLGGKRRILLSPDGALNLVPFAALVDEQGKYLVEGYSFTYLTSGRDLVRPRKRAAGTRPPVIIADPDFGASVTPGQAPQTRSSGALTSARFRPLPATSEEARALKAVMPAAIVLTRKQATETAVKSLNSPGVLHIAAHGFFLEDVAAKPSPPTGGTSAPPSLRDLTHTPVDSERPDISNPLLRSGLGLAGANLPRADDDDDGLLTALEVAGMNLLDTKLVVLSACDTGVGEVMNGDGVYGLRRALVLAGAESQVMSLWPVSDRGTKDFMTEYYRRLQAGEGRGDGLRQVQLRLLASPERSHPFYWASFIHSGEWAALADLR